MLMRLGQTFASPVLQAASVVTETLANFLCHPRQGSGRIDVATELGDDGSDPRLVVAIHCLAE